jgi:hypothetical protein
MMPNEQTSIRSDVGQWVGTLLWIIILESHVTSRSLAFLVGPFVVLASIAVIAFPIQRKKLRNVGLLTVAISIGGYVLTRYVFH